MLTRAGNAIVRADAAMISPSEYPLAIMTALDEPVALSHDEMVAQTISSRSDDAYDALPWL
jgi:hypothetical protein